MTCKECRYWYSHQTVVGRCKRKSPKAFFINNKVCKKWPETFEHDWCGEFEVREPEPMRIVCRTRRPEDDCYCGSGKEFGQCCMGKGII